MVLKVNLMFGGIPSPSAATPRNAELTASEYFGPKALNDYRLN
jgi:hypothetical protein